MSQVPNAAGSRKSPRIKNFDYRTENYYFITICTHQKRCLFYSDGKLNDYGIAAQDCLLQIPMRFAGYRIDKAVVMPNHVHAIIALESKAQQDLPTVIGLYKSAVSKRIHLLEYWEPIWQRSFHDHIIRNQAYYEKIWTYIDTNPLKWHEDCFYTEPTE